jgi:hypothetical protein
MLSAGLRQEYTVTQNLPVWARYKVLTACAGQSGANGTRLYERAGFATQKNISPEGAPPLIAMWRPAH